MYPSLSKMVDKGSVGGRKTGSIIIDGSSVGRRKIGSMIVEEGW